jgi:tetratricopeptide (TPR) repeat protein
MLLAAHQEDRQNASVICGIGVCYEKLNQIDEAAYWYRRSVETDTTLADGWFGLGICSLIKEQFSQAESLIKRALELNPEVEEFWYSLSEVYENLDSHDQARTCYEAALAIDPRFMEARVDYAILLANEFLDQEEALLVLNKGYEFHSNDDEFLYRYAGIMLDWGFQVPARDALVQALALNYDNHTLFFDYSETALNHPAFIRLIELNRS